VAVLSDAFWHSHFGADPSIVGRTIPLDDEAYEVVGIMPVGMTYPVGAVRPTDLWVPYVVPESQRIRGRGFAAYLQVIARLKPGMSVVQAQAQMDQVASAIEQANPATNKGNMVGVRPLHDHLVAANTRSWMLMLLGAVGIVLLIACANVANLLLARASAREREVAVRAALGASRWRLVRQLLAESLVLSLVGTALAIVLAWWTVQILKSAMPEGVPRVANIAVDLRVLAAAGLSLITGLLAGIVPALQLSRPDLTHSLKESTRAASAGRGRQRLRSALVVVEVALAVVLLVGAALFIGSFIALMRIDPGFTPEGVITTYVSPRNEPGQRAPDRSALFTQILERVSHAPGVVSAAASVGGVPLGFRARINGLRVKGREDEGQQPVWIKPVTPDYHKTVGIPLRSGRVFDGSDYAGGPKSVILSESSAKTFFPGEEAVGRTILMDGADRTVVGVVGDVRHSSLETGPRAEVYMPWSQTENGYGELLIRTSGDPHDVLPALKSAVLAVFPDVPLREVKTMEEVVARETAQRRLNMLMLGLFGLLGLVISAAGIYGVMAYVVAQRTREIGVRMALGATRSSVMRMVLANAGMLLFIGLVAGSGGASYLRATAKTFLFGLDATDPRAFAAAIVSLSVAALVASIIPARRAASVDPIVALRAE
jgi:putative ABC transport system permease protein